MASNLVPLGSLCSFENGDRGNNYPKECDYIDIGIPFISGSALNDGEIVRSGLKYISKEKFASLRAGKAHKGDILFSLRGSLGKCVISPFDESAIASALVIIRPNNNIDRDYLYFALNSPYFMKQCINYDNGSIQANLSVEAVKTFDIPLPSFSVQRKIAKILKHINNKIENNNAISAKLESLAKTIYDYWFLQFEFPNEDGKPYKSSGGKMIWNEELKREIPEGWNTTTIGDITINHDSERIPLASKERSSIQGRIPYYGATGIMGYVNRAIFKGDYVLLAEDGSVMDENGYPIIQRISGETWVNNHAHVLEPANGYHCRLLMMILKRVPVVLIKTGSIQMKINQENMNKYHVLNIPDKLKSKANSIFDNIDAELLRINDETHQLTSLRDFLLPMLMNGQVTFKEDA